MTRKDLQEKYNIIGENKEINLYRKQGEFSYGIGWCGTIALKNGKAVFNGKAYSTIADLDNALVEWEKSLPYPVDTYNPMCRPSYKVDNQLTWYLNEKLGFKTKHEKWNVRYAKAIGDDYELYFELEQDLDDESVRITTRFGEYHFTQKVTDTETGVAVISAIVNGECLSMAKDMIDLISVCDTKITSEIEAYTQTNENIFGIKPISFKDMMIERLEKVLAQLKGE